MIFNKEEIMCLVQTAKMYYEEDMTQAEIAKHLEVSRPMVSKMLSQARELGIVRIQIQSPFSQDDYLIDELKRQFGVQAGIIVPEAKTEYLTQEMILNQGVQYLESFLPSKSTIGLGWGYTMGQLVERLSTQEKENIKGTICPLIGTAHVPNKGYHPNELIRALSEKINMEPIFTYAPALPTSEEEREIYTQTEQQVRIQKHWENLDAVVIAIRDYPDVPDLATALRFGEKIHHEKVVGAFLAYYFTEDGKIIHSEKDFAIQIPESLLRKAKRVIAICTTNNYQTLVGALRMGIITDLIASDDHIRRIVNND